MKKGNKALIFALISLGISLLFLIMLLFFPFYFFEFLEIPLGIIGLGTAITAIVLGVKNKSDKKFALPAIWLGTYKLIMIVVHFFISLNSWLYYISRSRTIPLIIALGQTDFPVKSYTKTALPIIGLIILNLTLLIIFIIHYNKNK